MPREQQSEGQRKQRAFITGRFELMIDGHDCGILHSVDGGGFKSEAIGEKVGGEGLVTRYPGRQKFEEITLACGAEMAEPLWDWIRESIHNKPTRRNGDIVALDFDGYTRSTRHFADALVSEIQFPALDAKSKEPKRFTIKIAPERISYDTEMHPPAKRPLEVPIAQRQKMLLPSNFRFTLDGIDKEVTRRVTKIEAFSVKQNVIDNPVGGLLYTKKEAGRVEFPTLSFTLPESHVGPLMKWWEEFVGRGKHAASRERNGSIAYLDSSLSEEIGVVSLQGVGITGIAFDKHDGHSESIRSAKVELYVESLDFKFNKK